MLAKRNRHARHVRTIWSQWKKFSQTVAEKPKNQLGYKVLTNDKSKEEYLALKRTDKTVNGNASYEILKIPMGNKDGLVEGGFKRMIDINDKYALLELKNNGNSSYTVLPAEIDMHTYVQLCYSQNINPQIGIYKISVKDQDTYIQLYLDNEGELGQCKLELTDKEQDMSQLTDNILLTNLANKLFKNYYTTPISNYSGKQLRTWLQTFKITNIISSFHYESDKVITYNAGIDLLNVLSKKTILELSTFMPLLKSIETLNNNNVYYLDIKLDNITLKNGRFNLIDTDSISRPDKIARIFGTPEYTTQPLLQYLCNYKQHNVIDPAIEKILQVFDEYSFAMSILYGMGIVNYGDTVYNNNFSGIYAYYNSHNNPDTEKLDDFIKQTINPDDQDKFKQLLTNPLQYALNEHTSKSNKSLYAMFKDDLYGGPICQTIL